MRLTVTTRDLEYLGCWGQVWASYSGTRGSDTLIFNVRGVAHVCHYVATTQTGYPGDDIYYHLTTVGEQATRLPKNQTTRSQSADGDAEILALIYDVYQERS